MNLKGSKTEKNLLEAISAECLAFSKYKLFASAAKKEGYEQIADIFNKTATNEQAHAEIWMDVLEMISTDTEVNLTAAAERENYEWTDLYERFACEAENEGFADIAERFRLVGKIESAHEQRFKELISDIKLQTVFEKAGEVIWECRNCGHLVMGKMAPEVCPVCSHPQSYFEVKTDNYR